MFQTVAHTRGDFRVPPLKFRTQIKFFFTIILSTYQNPGLEDHKYETTNAAYIQNSEFTFDIGINIKHYRM